MQVIQSTTNISREHSRFVFFETDAVCNQIEQISTRDQFHDQKDLRWAVEVVEELYNDQNDLVKLARVCLKSDNHFTSHGYTWQCW